MRVAVIVLVSLLAAGSQAAPAPAVPAQGSAVDADDANLLCARMPDKCPRFRHVVSFPAHALSWSTFGDFALHTRGVDWTGSDGAMSLTMRRPKDFRGDRVRLLFFYQVLDDSAGDIQLVVTPVSLRHESSFETYGSVGTDPIAAPETLTILQERSVIVTGGYGWNPAGGEWWYFEIGRQGSFEGGLRLMSVAVEY
jgi:hypothetical protein